MFVKAIVFCVLRDFPQKTKMVQVVGYTSEKEDVDIIAMHGAEHSNIVFTKRYACEGEIKDYISKAQQFMDANRAKIRTFAQRKTQLSNPQFDAFFEDDDRKPRDESDMRSYKNKERVEIEPCCFFGIFVLSEPAKFLEVKLSVDFNIAKQSMEVALSFPTHKVKPRKIFYHHDTLDMHNMTKRDDLSFFKFEWLNVFR